MIIKNNEGKRVTDRMQLGRYSQIPGLSEIKDVDNCHNGKMFHISTRMHCDQAALGFIIAKLK
jgi:hypothetical protein